MRILTQPEPMVAGLILALFVACQDGAVPTEASRHLHEASLTVTSRLGVGQLDDGLMREVRQATARFSSTTQATKEGYVPESCVAVSGLGGMGVHWVAPALLDGVFDPFRPEVVLYEPQPDGRLELVAVEYIVMNTGQPSPTFDGQPFDIGGTPIPVPHWSLHVWIYRENPSGTFARFNPNVTCP